MSQDLPDFNPRISGKGELMGFRVVCKKWLQIKAIFAETGMPTSTLLRALREGHGIAIRDVAAPQDDGIDNPFLFFIVSEEQKGFLRKHELDSPTWLQLLGTSEVISLNEAEAVRRFRELKGDPRA